MSQEINNEDYKKWEEIKDKGSDDEKFEILKEIIRKNTGGMILYQKPNFLLPSNEFQCYYIYLHYCDEKVEVHICPQATEVKIYKKEEETKRNYYNKRDYNNYLRQNNYSRSNEYFKK